VKTAFKGKGFQDAEDIKKIVMADLNAVPLEAFADYFQKNFLYNSTNVFKLGENTFNISLYFLFLFFFRPVLELYCQTLYIITYLLFHWNPLATVLIWTQNHIQ
jgi:hypothetical protein